MLHHARRDGFVEFYFFFLLGLTILVLALCTYVFIHQDSAEDYVAQHWEEATPNPILSQYYPLDMKEFLRMKAASDSCHYSLTGATIFAKGPL